MSNVDMLRRLKVGLKQLKIAEKAQGDMASQLIAELPEDKKKEANELWNEAKKGKMDVAKFMNFSSGLRDSDKKEFDKNVEEAFDRINTKKAKNEAKKTSEKEE